MSATRSKFVPIATHTKAAKDHKLAAKAYEAAVECTSKGDHAAAIQNVTNANGCSDAAQKSTADAHGKSTMQAKK